MIGEWVWEKRDIRWELNQPSCIDNGVNFQLATFCGSMLDGAALETEFNSVTRRVLLNLTEIDLQ